MLDLNQLLLLSKLLLIVTTLLQVSAGARPIATWNSTGRQMELYNHVALLLLHANLVFGMVPPLPIDTMPVYNLVSPFLEPDPQLVDVFGQTHHRRITFFRNTGETPESFLLLANHLLPVYRARYNVVHVTNFKNKVLCVLLWLKKYLEQDILAAWFGCSTSSVDRYIQKILPCLWELLHGEIVWPTARE